jgi:hypothetical protein
LAKVLKIYDGEKTTSSTKTLGKLVSSLQKTETRSMYHPIPILTQNGSRILISDHKLKVGTGKSRKYFGINRYRQELSQWNPSSSATKR